MIHFEWPWLVLLLPLPILVRLFMQPAQTGKEAALRMPFLSDSSRISAIPSSLAHAGSSGWQQWHGYYWCLPQCGHNGWEN